MTQQAQFSDGDLVVYPTHGVGRLMKIENQVISGQTLKVLVINFPKSRMTLRLPLMKAKHAGLRALSTRDEIEQALLFLQRKMKATKGIWARRAQEYEVKINSGKLSSLAEVIRELYRPQDQVEQSYSERQIYQTAMDRLVTEIAAVETIAEEHVKDKVENILKIAA